MAKDKIDLRKNEWREAIIQIADAVKECPLTERGLALLISDMCSVKLTDVRKVLTAIPALKNRYLK